MGRLTTAQEAARRPALLDVTVTTVRQARDWLRERLEDGTECPCCRQHVQVYYRQINSGMAFGAVQLLRAHNREPFEFVHLPTVIGRRSAEESKLRYWDLAEEEIERRPDGGRSGWWRLTPEGVEWASGRSRVPFYALVYNGRLVRHQNVSKSGRLRPDVHVREALGHHFNYDALMRGEA